jgi:hypothetical protein
MSDQIVYELRSKADALKLLRSVKVNAHFYIHVSIDAQLPDTPDKYLPGAFRACINVSRGSAERFVDDAFSERLEKHGAALTIRVMPGTRRTRWDDKRGAFVEYGAARVSFFIG